MKPLHREEAPVHVAPATTRLEALAVHQILLRCASVRDEFLQHDEVYELRQLQYAAAYLGSEFRRSERLKALRVHSRAKAVQLGEVTCERRGTSGVCVTRDERKEPAP